MDFGAHNATIEWHLQLQALSCVSPPVPFPAFQSGHSTPNTPAHTHNYVCTLLPPPHTHTPHPTAPAHCFLHAPPHCTTADDADDKGSQTPVLCMHYIETRPALQTAPPPQTCASKNERYVLLPRQSTPDAPCPSNTRAHKTQALPLLFVPQQLGAGALLPVVHAGWLVLAQGLHGAAAGQRARGRLVAGVPAAHRRRCVRACAADAAADCPETLGI